MMRPPMRKVSIVFVLAVIAPSLVLAWLAVRSLRDQELVLERQRTLLYQGVADSLAQKVQQQIAEKQREFAQHVESFCGKREPSAVALQFDDYLRGNWPLADVGFVVTLGGALTCPPLPGRDEGQMFRRENEAFLAGNLSCSVSWSSPKGAVNFAGTNVSVATTALMPAKTGVFATKKGGDESVVPAEAKFVQIVGNAREGTLARFLQDQLKLLFWYRPTRDASLVFGSQVKLPGLLAALKPCLNVDAPLDGEICVALLDDNSRLVTMTPRDFPSHGSGHSWPVKSARRSRTGRSRSIRWIPRGPTGMRAPCASRWGCSSRCCCWPLRLGAG